MHHIEVLGFDCTACRKISELVGEVARDRHRHQAGESQPPTRLAANRALAVPAIAIDGKLLHSGSLPSRKTITAWLTSFM